MSDYDKQSKMDIVKSLINTALPGSPKNDEQKMAILVKCSEDLERSLKNFQESIDKHAQSNNSLGNKLYYLNAVLTVATVIMATTGIISLFFS